MIVEQRKSLGVLVSAGPSDILKKQTHLLPPTSVPTSLGSKARAIFRALILRKKILDRSKFGRSNSGIRSVRMTAFGYPLSWSSQLKFGDLLVQGASGDSQFVRGVGDVPGAAKERLFDRVPFHLLQTDHALLDGPAGGLQQQFRQVPPFDDLPIGK